MTRLVRTVLMVWGFVGLMACNTLLAQEDVPAVLVDSSDSTRVELQQAISTALNGRRVTVSDDALTRESELIIERVVRRDSAGLPLTGRDFGKPEHFTLVKRGEQCVLVHQRTGKRFPLESAQCQAIAR